MATGGASDKLGNRYEREWAVKEFIRVLRDEADSIRIEVPFVDGAEFVVKSGADEEWHQAKRSKSGNPYTPASIGKILAKLTPQYRAGNTTYFVTSEDTRKLGVLIDDSEIVEASDEFVSKLSKENGPNFKKFWTALGAPDEATGFQWLRQTRLTSVDENYLVKNNRDLISFIVSGDPVSAIDALHKIADDNIGKILTAEGIWVLLEERKITKSLAISPESFNDVCTESCKVYLASQAFTINGLELPRGETQSIVKSIEECQEHASITFLHGRAGFGKSCVVHTVVNTLNEAGWATYVIRADRETLGADAFEVIVGGESVPIHQALHQLAKDRNVLLVVDQLDAISDVSGRNSGAFDELSVQLRSLVAVGKVHLLIGCRTHDLLFDSRFRSLEKEFEHHPTASKQRVEVKELCWETVSVFLEQLDIDPNKFSARVRILLCVPAQLRMFAEIADDLDERDIDGLSPQKLLQKYWETKRHECSRQFPKCDWDDAIGELVRLLTEEQALSIPRVRLNRVHDSISALVSMGVLVQGQDKRVAFFHEMFFDYVFARLHVGTGQSLKDWLLGGNQALFQRGQVRQILLYQRSEDPATFLWHVSEALECGSIRPHIKQAIFQTLNLIEDPTVSEWETIEPYWRSHEDELSRLARQVTWRSKHWLDLLDGQGLITSILSENDEILVDLVFSLLRGLDDESPEVVARHAHWALVNKPEFDHQVGWLLSLCGFQSFSAHFIAPLNVAIDRGLFDNIQNDGVKSIWSLCSRKNIPDVHVLELFERYLKSSVARGICQSELSRDIHDTDWLERLATKSPNLFVKSLFNDVMTILDIVEGNVEWYVSSSYLSLRGSDRSFQDVIYVFLSEYSRAIGRCMYQDPGRAWSVLRDLASKNTDMSSAMILLAAEAAPSPEIAGFLVSLLRTEIGRDPQMGRIYSHQANWARAYRSLSSLLSVADVRQIEAIVAGIYPSRELDSDYFKHDLVVGSVTNIGQTQYTMLSGLVDAPISRKIGKRLDEWERKFQRKISFEHDSGRGGYVGSPLPDIAHEKMSDDQWLLAIGKGWPSSYAKSATDGRLLGGVDQLARLGFGERVKEEPDRFTSLMLERFDETTPDVYWEAGLQSVAGLDEIDAIVVDALVEKTSGRKSRDLRLSLIRCLRAHVDKGLSDASLRTLCSLAINDLDPVRSSDNRVSRDDASEKPRQGKGIFGGNKLHGSRTVHGILTQALDVFKSKVTSADNFKELERAEDIEMESINSVRGVAAEALSILVHEFPEKVGLVEDAIQSVLSDDCSSVRGSAIRICWFMLDEPLNGGVARFLKTVKGRPQLWTLRNTRRFMRMAVVPHWKELRRSVKKLINSKVDELEEEGAILLSLAWLNGLTAERHVTALLKGSVAHRKGLTRVCIGNIWDRDYFLQCSHYLEALFYDQDEDVRKLADDFFRGGGHRDLAEYSDLFENFVNSPAFGKHSGFMHLLDNAPSVPSELLLQTSDALVRNRGSDLADLRTASPIEAETISKLLVRAYKNSNDEEFQSKCLDRIDSLVLNGAYGLDKAVSEYDRW